MNHTVSDAQLAANKANAQLSTGPTSEEGRRRSSLNSLKHGLTSRTALLPGEDREAYNACIQAFVDQYRPANAEEEALVQTIGDCQWRKDRIFAMEAKLFSTTEDPAALMAAQADNPGGAAKLLEAEIARQKQ